MVATYSPHLRLSFGGSLGDSKLDIWTNTLKWHVLGTPPNRELLVEAAAQCVPGISNWFQRPATKISSNAHLEWIKLNWIDADGKQRDTDTVLFDLLAPVSGNDSQFIPPWYQTFAITLRTRVSRGRGHSGRIFPPMVVFNAQAGAPYTSTGIATAMADSFVTMVRDVRTAMGVVWQDEGVGVPDLSVISVGSTTAPVRPALWTPVIAAVCDRVPDVQHRRTNRVPRAEGDTVIIDP